MYWILLEMDALEELMMLGWNLSSHLATQPQLGIVAAALRELREPSPTRLWISIQDTLFENAGSAVSKCPL